MRVGGFRGGLRGCACGRARLPIEHERPARRLRRQQLLVQAAVRRVTCGAMGGRGSSGLDRGSSGRGCGARYRRRAAPPPRAAARGTASALRLVPAVAAHCAPGGAAGAHARAGLAEQYGVGPRTTDTCSASSASSHETMLMPVRRACTLAARDLSATHAASAIVKGGWRAGACRCRLARAHGPRCSMAMGMRSWRDTDGP